MFRIDKLRLGLTRYRPLLLGRYQTRRLDWSNLTAARLFSNYYRKITPDVMKKLYYLENYYEQDPTNQKAAYRYFRELNRHGKHHTVVRLYNRYFDDYDKRIKGGAVFREKLREQFEYAEDTIYSVKRAIEENEEEVILPESNNKGSKAIFYKMIDFGCKAVYWALMVYVGLILIGSIDFKKDST